MANGDKGPALIAPSPMNGTCLSCKFFNHADKAAAPECRRFPPTTTLFIAGVTPEGPQFNRATTFASTQPEAWCGEHKPRIKLDA